LFGVTIAIGRVFTPGRIVGHSLSRIAAGGRSNQSTKSVSSYANLSHDHAQLIAIADELGNPGRIERGVAIFKKQSTLKGDCVAQGIVFNRLDRLVRQNRKTIGARVLGQTGKRFITVSAGRRISELIQAL
jgi:hypothetical protein